MSLGAAALLRRFVASARAGSRPPGAGALCGARCGAAPLWTAAMGKGGPKFYGVRRGRTPGVFTSWAECEQQVKGHPGAVHKSFHSQAEAAAFVAGVNAGAPAAARKRKPRSRSRSPGAAPRRRVHSAAGDAADGEAGGEASAALPGGFTHTLQFDGGARGNPGPAGAGAVLLRGGDTPVAEAGVWLGPHSTCNEAEYTGLIAGLRLAARCGVQRLRVQGDSTLVTRQMKGEWRVSAPGLMPLQAQAAQAASAFEAITFAYIPRAENARADALANRAMDLRESFDAVHVALAPHAQPADAA